MTSQILVVGAGVFGGTAAVTLRRRGHQVTLLEPGPHPHPLAASTDISKVLRMAYGADAWYTAMMEQAFAGWRQWADGWAQAGLEPMYHETGVLMVCRDPMRPGGFEHDSLRMLEQRGHAADRLDADSLAQRFPAWSTGTYVDGFFQALGGYGESGRITEWLVREARAAGVSVVPGRMTGLVERGGSVSGVVTADGGRVPADHVVLATGAWAGKLLGFRHEVRATGHPVVHFRPADPTSFQPERFPVFTADVARTGLYGFPATRDGVVKMALHDPGEEMDPDAPREVTPAQIDRIRALVADSFPALADAAIVYTRLCLYADTQDGDFWIASDPDREGLTVATGGSGHGFKFAPMLGDLIADIVEGKPNPLAGKFRWRPDVKLEKGKEAARFHGD